MCSTCQLEVVAKIGELDRANLREGQDVLMRLDAVGDKVFHGKIKSMSGTASANIFSGDPAKKFDVVFSIDMKELLSGLGAKPEQVKKILAQAEANRHKAPAAGIGGPMALGGGGQVVMASAPGGGGDAAGAPPGASGGAAAAGGGNMMIAGAPTGPSAGGGPMRMMANVSPEDQKKAREAMQKALKGRLMADLTPEERQKVMEEVRKAVPAMAAMQRGGGPGGAGAPGAGGPAGPTSGGSGRFSEKDLENANLPPPIDPSNQLEVLLRPGLLADVEIILEKIPNAINIPAGAVFEKDGQQIVYVRKGSVWEERPIRPAKRSESVMVIASGVKPGETIAMANPNEKPGDKKKKEKPAGGSAVGSLPGGGRS